MSKFDALIHGKNHIIFNMCSSHYKGFMFGKMNFYLEATQIFIFHCCKTNKVYMCYNKYI